MNEKINILIIDDHPMIIDAYKRAIANLRLSLEGYEFNIDSANDCCSGYDKVLNASKENKIDLILLDISLPPCDKNNIQSGEDLGQIIKRLLPDAKIMVITSYNDNFRINNILVNLIPNGFLLKGDMSSAGLGLAIKSILSGSTYYSKTVSAIINNKINAPLVLDKYDITILNEISNGARMKELMEHVPLSKSGIEKRKQKLKVAFKVKNEGDRALVLTAREKGFI